MGMAHDGVLGAMFTTSSPVVRLVRIFDVLCVNLPYHREESVHSSADVSGRAADGFLYDR